MESIIMIVSMFALLYFMLIRPEKKRKQQAQQMRDGLKKGDTITTIGGIIGKVVSIDKDTFVIETSEDRVRVQFAKWALSTVGVQTGEQPEAKKKEESAATEGADSSTPAEVPAETTSETDEEK